MLFPLRRFVRWQDGTTGVDVLRASAVGDYGSVFVAGTTNGRRGKPRGRSDVTAVKLDENGMELWRWQVYGLRDTDSRRTIPAAVAGLPEHSANIPPSSFFFRRNRVVHPKVGIVALQVLH